MELTATVTAEMTGISLPSVNTIHLKIRQRLTEAFKHGSPLNGFVEVDESYFGAYRVRGRRGRGAYGKTIVFALLKPQSMVYSEIMLDCKKDTLHGIIRRHNYPPSVIHSDG